MIIQRVGDVPSAKGSDKTFRGTVRQDKLITAEAPGRVATGQNTFEPGARTAWHTHPAGQILIITGGRGWVQCEGQPRQEVRMGDAVWFPPDVRHWHGATSTTAMMHISVTESVDGSPVTWMEHVTDQEYDPQS